MPAKPLRSPGYPTGMRLCFPADGRSLCPPPDPPKKMFAVCPLTRLLFETRDQHQQSVSRRCRQLLSVVDPIGLVSQESCESCEQDSCILCLRHKIVCVFNAKGVKHAYEYTGAPYGAPVYECDNNTVGVIIATWP